MKYTKPVFVTQPSLPPLDEFLPYLEEIWATKILTNGGKFHNKLEEELCEYLDVEYISLFSNGTLALITALQALEISREVITTPYSFVATSHSLLWNRLKPVFVDIDAHSFNLDPKKIEAAITSETSAILPVHCYGAPCDVDAIGKIAEKYNLKVIYDAAHAFGVKCHCGNLLKHGDLSVLSFHATKVFTTFEGGAVVSSNPEIKKRIDYLKNFGFTDEVTVVAPGINAKMSELNAAIGLLQLKHLDANLSLRKEIDQKYRSGLHGVKGIACARPTSVIRHNYAYFPILVQEDYPLSRDELYEKLKTHGVFARRYFYPLISDFPIYRDLAISQPATIPVATDVSLKILCLPMYPSLSAEDSSRIIELIRIAV